MTVEPDAPTVVLAVGDAGFRMLSRLSEILEDENYDRERFLLLAVDSGPVRYIEEVDEFARKRQTLHAPDDWQTKQEQYPYLTESDPPTPDGVGSDGVGHDREVGRAIIEDEVNLNRISNWLEAKLSRFAVHQHHLNIWLVNGLGGGTGSSITPMLIGIIPLILDRNGITADVFGLSTVPKLDVKADSEFDPEFNSPAVSNAFAALAELEPLLDRTSEHAGSEPTIDLHLETEHVPLLDDQDGHSLSHLRKYYLLGVDEEALSQESGTYAEEVEKTAAFTILVEATTSETFPEYLIDSYANRVLRSCDLTECGFPYEDASLYIRQEIGLRSLKNDREQLRELVSRVEDENTSGLLEEHERMVDRAKNVTSSAENIGNKALEAAFDETKTSFGDDEIDMYLQWSELRNARTKIEDDGQNRIDIDKPAYTELRSTFDGVGDIRDQITHDGFRPELPREYLSESDDDSVVLPSRYVIEYLYFVAVRQEVRERVKEQRDEFENALEALYEHDQVRPKMDQQQRVEFNIAADATVRWEHVLSDFIDDRADYLNEKVDIYPLTDLDALAAELRSEKQNVENKKADYEAWEKLYHILDEIVESKQSVLRDLSKNYEERQDRIRDDIKCIDDKIAQEANRQEAVKTRLQEASGTQKFKKFRIESPADLIVTYFQMDGKSLLAWVEELKDEYGTADATDPDKEAIRRHLRNELTIQDLVSSEIVDRTEIFDDVTEALELTKKRVTKKGTGSDGVLIPISHPKDDWLEALGSESYAQWAAAADRTRADFAATDRIPHRGGKRGYLRFLFVNPDVELDNTYIYDSMRQWYEEGRLLDLMDTSEDDPSEAVNWAYPELAEHILE